MVSARCVRESWNVDHAADMYHPCSQGLRRFLLLKQLGHAAIPINMCILGINLSITSQMKSSTNAVVSDKTVAAVVIAKMIVIPAIGILSAIVLKNYIWNIPDGTFKPSQLLSRFHVVGT